MAEHVVDQWGATKADQLRAQLHRIKPNEIMVGLTRSPEGIGVRLIYTEGVLTIASASKARALAAELLRVAGVIESGQAEAYFKAMK